jgi:hypothetical protein
VPNVGGGLIGILAQSKILVLGYQNAQGSLAHIACCWRFRKTGDHETAAINPFHNEPPPPLVPTVIFPVPAVPRPVPVADTTIFPLFKLTTVIALDAAQLLPTQKYGVFAVANTPGLSELDTNRLNWPVLTRNNPAAGVDIRVAVPA